MEIMESFFKMTADLLWGDWLLAAVLLFIQNAGATLIQSNTISQVTGETFQIPSLLTGIFLAVAMSFIISGGFKRLVKVAQHIVPIMAGIYITGGIMVLIANTIQIPEMFTAIIQGAFSLKAGTGALAGLTVKEVMRFGVARGLYSNEAGEGSAAVFHSSAKVDHPVRQGFYGVIEVFIDTMLYSQYCGAGVSCTGSEKINKRIFESE